MTLLQHSNERSRRSDLWLGGVTAVVAGLVNVCSVVAFFSFASNVTGHVAIFVEELVKGHWHQIAVVITWLFCFLSGAGLANFFVYGSSKEEKQLRVLVPVALEFLLVGCVAYYGTHHYSETLRETEVLTGMLLMAMGIQNGLVSSVSKGVVKTTHLTGLMTDLGMEIAQLLRPERRGDEVLLFKFRLHVVILGAYMVGGCIGGYLFLQLKFLSFYVACAMLSGVALYEVLHLRSANAEARSRRATALVQGSTSMG